MWAHGDDDEKIAGLAAALARLALTANGDDLAVVDAGGDAHGAALGGAHLAAPVALRAGIGDDLARALAVRAGAHVLDGAKGRVGGGAHLARAVAGGAGLGLRAGLGARALAIFARLVAHEVDLLVAAPGRFLKGDGDIVAQVRAGHGALLAPGAAAAETAAKERREYVFHIKAAETAEAGEISIAAGAARARLLMAEAVVLGALLGVGEHLIGLVDLLEFFLGVLVARVDVRVQLLGQLAVRRLDGGLVGRALDAEHFIIVAFCQGFPLPLCERPEGGGETASAPGSGYLSGQAPERPSANGGITCCP